VELKGNCSWWRPAALQVYWFPCKVAIQSNFFPFMACINQKLAHCPTKNFDPYLYPHALLTIWYATTNEQNILYLNLVAINWVDYKLWTPYLTYSVYIDVTTKLIAILQHTVILIATEFTQDCTYSHVGLTLSWVITTNIWNLWPLAILCNRKSIK